MPSDPFSDPFAEPAKSAPPKKGAKGGKKKHSDSGPTKLENFGETGKNTLENFGETGASTLENFGETGKNSLENFGETGANTLENFGETGANTLENFGETGKNTLENFGETGANTLENFGETGPTTLENFGETGPTTLENFGETGATAYGDHGAPEHDPFAASATMAEAVGGETDATRDEPPSEGPLGGANEDNLYAVVGDQPEPDSQPGYGSQSGGGSGSRSASGFGATSVFGSGAAARPRDGGNADDEASPTVDLPRTPRLGGPIEAESPDDASAPTVDLPQDSLANLGKAEFADDPANLQKGGSESLTMSGSAAHEADADKTSDLDPEDLRQASASPLARGDDTADQTGPEGETRDQSGNVDGEATSDEAEPDFLYGERFSERYSVPEAPVQPSKGPKVFALLGILLLLGAGAGGYWKLVIEPEQAAQNGSTGIATTSSGGRSTGVTSGASTIKPSAGASTGPSISQLPTPPVVAGGSTSPSAGATAGGSTSTSASAIRPPVSDEPPPLPPPADAIDAKLRRALGFGLPILPKQPSDGNK